MQQPGTEQDFVASQEQQQQTPPPLAVPYQTPGVTFEPLAPGDSLTGWRIAGWLMIAGVAMQLLTIAVLSMNASNAAASSSVYTPGRGSAAMSKPSVPPSMLIGSLIGAALSGTCAYALLTAKHWARILALVLIALAMVGQVSVAFAVNERELPFGSRAVVVLLALVSFAGWYVLIDRPATRVKIQAGAVTVGLVTLIGFVRLAMLANTGS
jgi:hypothetical protein